MTATTQDADQLRHDFATEVVRQLTAAGYEAVWAGGCVRDFLMGKSPADYDVATSATPDEVRQLFGHRRTLAVGAAFGVIVVLPPHKAAGQVEVATFRTETTYTDGRRPDSVSFSTAYEDAQRRDFTINGMFYNPLDRQVLDYVGGRDDLQQRCIRAIGDADQRIAEDKLRMLRAIRFAAQLNFEIDQQTYSALCRHAHDITAVSEERVSVELRKCLVSARAAWAIKHLAQTGLLAGVLPVVFRHWDHVGERTLQVIQATSDATWTCRLAGLLWPTVDHCCSHLGQDPRDLVSEIKATLRLSNEDADALQFAFQAQSLLIDAEHRPWSAIQPLLVNRHHQVAIELLAARIESRIVSDEQAENVVWLRSRLHLPDSELNPEPLLAGKDLISLGLKPGPQFRHLLQTARDRQLDGLLTDRTAALSWLKSQSAAPEKKRD